MIQRDATFDVMKGIAILAMVVGHCPIPKLLEQFIFVWHMPLFFLVSGYFYKQKSEKVYIQKNMCQLLVPYAVTASLLITIAALKQYFVGKGSTMTVLIAALVGNGSGNNPTFSAYSIGAIWFLLAIFWCRCIYNSLQKRISSSFMMGGGIIVSSVIATYIGSMRFIPTSILEGMGALLFFYIGHMAHLHKLLEWNISKRGWVVIILLSILSIHAGSMSMVRCYYGYWPINVLAAVCMTMFIYRVAYHLKENRFLAYCGRISMVILCVHLVEMTYFPLKTLHERFYFSDSFDILIHLFLSVSISYIILKIHFVQKLFSVK